MHAFSHSLLPPSFCFTLAQVHHKRCMPYPHNTLSNIHFPSISHKMHSAGKKYKEISSHSNIPPSIYTTSCVNAILCRMKIVSCFHFFLSLFVIALGISIKMLCNATFPFCKVHSYSYIFSRNKKEKQIFTQQNAHG